MCARYSVESEAIFYLDQEVRGVCHRLLSQCGESETRVGTSWLTFSRIDERQRSPLFLKSLIKSK